MSLRSAIRASLGRDKQGLLRYWYQFSPAQLIYLCETAEACASLGGCFVEAGCAEAHSTIFINRYLRDKGISPDYLCIDTFAGFVDEHVAHEITVRGKAAYRRSYGRFRDNSKAAVDAALARNGLTNVRTEVADVARYPFAGPIAWCLLDVDLYKPIQAALPRIWSALLPQGVLIVDDCSASAPQWDGALQAYNEFCRDTGQDPLVVAGKLGVLTKPLAPAPAVPRVPAYGQP
jgi:SAM-dependent methyltransferase